MGFKRSKHGGSYERLLAERAERHIWIGSLSSPIGIATVDDFAGEKSATSRIDSPADFTQIKKGQFAKSPRKRQARGKAAAHAMSSPPDRRVSFLDVDDAKDEASRDAWGAACT